MNIGNVLNSAMGRVAVDMAVRAAKDAATKTSNPMDVRAVEQARPDIEKSAAEVIAATPELQHMTNSEAWYQKRSRWAAIIAGVTPLLALLAKYMGWEFGEGEREFIVTIFATAGGLWAAYLSYRAGTATKPLFT